MQKSLGYADYYVCFDNRLSPYEHPIDHVLKQYENNIMKDLLRTTLCPINIYRIKNAPKYTIDWNVVSLNADICPIKDILDNHSLSWRIDLLHKRSDFTLGCLSMYPFIKWSFDKINGAWDVIRKNPRLEWNWRHIITLERMPWIDVHMFIPDSILINMKVWKNMDWNVFNEFLVKRIHACKAIGRISCIDAGIPIHVIKKNSGLPWSWDVLSCRRDLDWKALIMNTPYIIDFNIFKRLDGNSLSRRKDIPLWIIVLCFDAFNSKLLVRNPCVKRAFVEKYWWLPWKGCFNTFRREKAAKIIQKRWRDVVYNPYTELGKRRLLSEYRGLLETPMGLAYVETPATNHNAYKVIEALNRLF
jgi:hypothetical protein